MSNSMSRVAALRPEPMTWPVQSGNYGMLSVLEYGAEGDGVTDDTAAFQACADARIVALVPPGTYKITDTIAIRSNSGFVGNVWQPAKIVFCGASKPAFANLTPASIVYNCRFANLYVVDDGVGTPASHAFDLETCQMCVLENVVAEDFTTGFELRGDDSAHGAVYNRFYNCRAEDCGTGFKLTGPTANANVFSSCRANNCDTYGWEIFKCNDNTLNLCQIEGPGMTSGVYVHADAQGYTGGNRVLFSRFESSTTMTNGIEIAVSGGGDVSHTIIGGNYFVGGVTNQVVDGGENTQIIGGYQTGIPLVKLSSAMAPASDFSKVPYRFTRTSHNSAGDPELTDPLALFEDTSGSTSANQCEVEFQNARVTGLFWRAKQGANLKAKLTGYGDLWLAGAWTGKRAVNTADLDTETSKTMSVATDLSGTVYILGAAGATTITLPAVAGSVGANWEFVRLGAGNMVITGPANTLVAENNAAATTVTWSAAGQIIGSAAKVTSDGSKWYVINQGATPVTVT